MISTPDDFQRKLYRELHGLPPIPPPTRDQLNKARIDKEKRRMGQKKATYEMSLDALQDIWWLVDHGGYTAYSHVVNDAVRAMAKAALACRGATLGEDDARLLAWLVEVLEKDSTYVVSFALRYLAQELRKGGVGLDPAPG